MRAVTRRAVVLVAAAGGASVLAAGMLAGAASAAGKTPPALYAYAGGTAVSPGSCPQDTASPPVPSKECSLGDAIALAVGDNTIYLATPGSSQHYVGNWTVSSAGTGADSPVTIEPAPGLSSRPELDGNRGSSTGCSTTTCDGSVLIVPAGEYVNLSGITIADGDYSGGKGGNGPGGGLYNAGTVTITGVVFAGNTGLDGGAIDTGEGVDNTGTSLTVTASTFIGNSASNDGGAIDSGDEEGAGSVIVNDSLFLDDTATFDGGAIDSGDEEGAGSVTVSDSSFANNTAGLDGGAIDSGDFGAGTVTVAASTFENNTADGDGGVIDSGDEEGAGSVSVAGNLFDGSCDQPGGTWTDGGYNAGTDTSCFGPGAPVDASGTAVGSDLQALATDNGGVTASIEPTAGNPAIGLIPKSTTISLGGSQVQLCPAIDQRGYQSAPGTACDAGAVQTSGVAPKLTAGPDPSQVTLGTSTSLGDTANLDGGFSPTGTITFTLYDPSNTLVYTDDVPVSGSGTYSTASGDDPGGFIPTVAGTYQWDVTYSGDAENSPLSDTGDPGEQVAVSLASQAITFTSAPPATPVVGETYDVTATGGGSGNPVTFTIDSSSAGVCTISGSTVTFTNPGNCLIDAAQAGNAEYAAATESQSVPVSQAATTTTVTVQPGTITAQVAPSPPGAGDPTGTVTFSVDGSQVGTAQLSGGTAVLTYAVPAGATRQVAAVYGGDTDFAGSSGSTARHDPSITAAISSQFPKTKYGWYRSPVTVTFTCTPNGAPVTCPQPQTVSSNGAGQSVTATVTATDGGAASITVSGINIDQTSPVITVHGAVSGRSYDAPGPKVTCTGSDPLSGLAGSCKVAITLTASKLSWRATVTNEAGTTASTTGHATLIDYYIAGAAHRNGEFVVAVGHTYQVIAYVATRKAPRYVDATPAGVRPHPDGPAMTRIGTDLWAVRVKLIVKKTRHRIWHAGVLVGKTLHLIALEVRKK